jgi:exonuclease SbcC
MQILSVTLKNFKCHLDRYVEFQPGFNAISGENGAGKSSILEAIAWVLFNHTDYDKDQMIRRGAKVAQVAVQFISRADGRTYRVERSTSSGYRVIDPQINRVLEITRVNEEVTPWLKTQLGISPSANLPRLFADMIGIPQGTFTADFLKRPRDRKEVFNPLLKVEEYDRAAAQSLGLENLAKAAVQDITQQIAHYEDRLRDWDDLKQQQQQLEQELAQDQATLAQLTSDLAAMTQEKATLAAIAADVQQLEQTLRHLTAQLATHEQTTALRQQTLEAVQSAVAVCAANQEAYETYLAAETALAELNQHVQTRQALLTQRQAEQARLETGRQEMIRLEVQLEALRQAAIDLDRLAPLVRQQTALEQSQVEIANQLQQLAAAKQEQITLTRQHDQAQTRLSQLAQELDRLQALATTLAIIPDLEQQRNRLQSQLSHITAARQFQTELQRLVQPAVQERDRLQADWATTLAALEDLQTSLPLYRQPIAQAIAALERGHSLTSTLIAGLEAVLADLSQQSSEAVVTQHLETLTQRLHQAYQHQAEVSTLHSKQTQLVESRAEVTRLQERLAELATQLAAEPALQQRHAALAAELAALENPRGRSQLLQQQLQQQDSLQARFSQLQLGQADIQARYDRLTEQLQPFAELDAALAEQTNRRQQVQAGYTQYVQHQQQAAQLAEAKEAFQAATCQLVAIQHQRTIAEQAWQERSRSHDPQRLAVLETRIADALASKNQLAGKLPLNQQRLQQLQQQLAERAALAKERDRARQTLAIRQNVAQFITTARTIYRQAGPRITRFYLGEISREADRLFRDLMNRQNLALEWTEDYEIRVQEAGYWRSFSLLSGGEQMCAALAVRLALLKVLADVDIAFFDEPTTNMDLQRRQQLAQALTNLKAFRQIVVISHDDTFENLTENVIRIERA